LISGPTRVIGFPRIVTAPLRSSAMSEFSLGDEIEDERETLVGVGCRGKAGESNCEHRGGCGEPNL
jgi:hypothetical protein